MVQQERQRMGLPNLEHEAMNDILAKAKLAPGSPI
jgi:hypothetical protein